MKFYQLSIGMKTILSIIFISFSLSFYANNHIPSKSYLDQLSEVNKEWLHHQDACPKGLISFDSDIDRIQLHLNLVVKYLKSNAPSNLSAKQLSNRLFLLEKLQQYADKKVFPINKYHLTRQPYFVDDNGTNCAVGQMIYDSGHKDLVAKISKEHNYDYIKDIHTEGLTEWTNEFGFTVEELKWIQPTYAPSAIIDQVLNGTNGHVAKIVNIGYNQGLIIAGDFTELDSLPCLNIGIYKNDQLSCLGSGIDGKINDVLNQQDGIYAFGEFHHNGQVFPIAKYDGSSWSYIGIPGRDSALCTAANSGRSEYQFGVAINHSSISQHQEVWHYLNDNTWEKQAKVKGIILDIIPYLLGDVYAGHFDSVVVYNTNATVDTTIIVNNVIINSKYPTQWYGIGNNISDTVNVVKEVGGALIFGGTCSYQSGENNVCLSRYLNSVLQPLFLNDTGTKDYSINTIAYHDYGKEFTFGGNFEIIPQMMGNAGNNLATYNLINNRIEVIAIFDHPVNSITFLNNDLYIGGDFQKNIGDSINFLGRITSTAGINEFVADKNLKIYPNPFKTTINLENIKDGVPYSIHYIDGRIAKKGTVLNEKINNLDFLPKGTYLLKLETENGSVVKKIFK